MAASQELMKGYMGKKSPKARLLGVWQHRFFVLTPLELTYYKKHDRAEMGGTIPLKDIVNVTYFPHKKDGGRLDCHIKGGRVFELEAADKILAKGWVMAINKARKMLKDAEEASAVVKKDAKEGGIKLTLLQEKFFEVLQGKKDPHFANEQAMEATGFPDELTILSFLLSKTLASASDSPSSQLPYFVEWDEEFESEVEQSRKKLPDTTELSRQIIGYFSNRDSGKSGSQTFLRLKDILKQLGTISPFRLYACLATIIAADLRRYACLVVVDLADSASHLEVARQLMQTIGYKFDGHYPRDEGFPEEQARHPLLLLLLCGYSTFAQPALDAAATLCKSPPHALTRESIDNVLQKLSNDEIVQFLRLTGEPIGEDQGRRFPRDHLMLAIMKKFQKFYLFEAAKEPLAAKPGLLDDLDDIFDPQPGSSPRKPAAVAAAAGSPPPPPPDDDISPPVQCEECEVTIANVFCEDCDQKFCKPCAEELHQKGGRARHVRRDIPVLAAPAAPAAPAALAAPAAPKVIVPCEECEDSPKPADFYCTYCKQSLCPVCDENLHKKGKRAAHIRTHLIEGKKLELKLCEECDKDPVNPANVSCPECEQHLCSPCDERIHAKGNRAAHVRNPANLEFAEQKRLLESKALAAAAAAAAAEDEAKAKAKAEEKKAARAKAARGDDDDAAPKMTEKQIRENKAMAQTALGRVHILVQHFEKLIRLNAIEANIERRKKEIEKSVQKAGAPPPSPAHAAGPADNVKYKVVQKVRLPENWQELVDPGTGKKYYYNAKFQQTSWDAPPGSKTEMVAVVESDWQELTDPATGRRYFYNPVTAVTSWDPPHELVALQEAAERKMRLDLTRLSGPLDEAPGAPKPVLHKKLGEGIYDLAREGKQGSGRGGEPSQLVVGFRARPAPFAFPDTEPDRFVPMVLNAEFIRRLMSVFKEFNPLVHSLALRVLWIHMLRTGDMREIENRFAEYVEIHASGDKFSKYVFNALLCILLTSNICANLDLKLIIVPSMGVIVPTVWKSVFFAMKKSSMQLRKNALEDINAVLYDSPHNCQSVSQSPGWQAWMWPVLEDVHKGDQPECQEVERNVFANANNVLTTIHFHSWRTSATFMTGLCASIESIRDFAGFTDTSQELARLCLFSLASCILHHQHRFSSEYNKNEPHWQNVVALEKVCQKFVFCTAYWRTAAPDEDHSSVVMKKEAREAMQRRGGGGGPASPIRKQDDKQKEIYVISASRTVSREKFEPFWKEDHKLLEYGLHFTENGDVADGPLVEKVVKLFQMLGLDHIPLNPHMGADEKQFRAYCVGRFQFWQDAQRIVASIQGRALLKRQITLRQMGHYLQKFVAAPDTKGRLKVISTLEQLQSQAEYQEMSAEFEEVAI